MSVALWRFWDSIDDRSFNAFCAAEPLPSLLRDAGWITNGAVSVAGAIPLFAMHIPRLLSEAFPALGSVAAFGLGVAASVVIGLGLTVWRLHSLTYVWSVQKTLRRASDSTPKLWRRALSAVLYFVGVTFLAVLAGDIPAFIAPAGALFTTFKPLLLPAVFLLVLLVAIRIIRRLWARRRFLGALAKMRRRGEISYVVHGHPYLAVLSPRINFALTVIDEPLRSSDRPFSASTPTVYQVAVAECSRRRNTVLLCDNHVYRFRITFIRLSWYRSHTVEFPEEEGRRILIVDPTPAHLRIDGNGHDLDNGSEAFDYTVYGRNAFLHLLERY